MIDTTAPPQRYTVLALDRHRPRAARLAAGSQPLEPSQTIDQRSRSVDDLARVLTELSSVISRLEAVAARHRDELDLQPRLHNAISQLESIGHDLLTEGDTGGANPSADEGHVEAFLTWLSFHTGTDEGEGPISPPSCPMAPSTGSSPDSKPHRGYCPPKRQPNSACRQGQRSARQPPHCAPAPETDEAKAVTSRPLSEPGRATTRRSTAADGPARGAPPSRRVAEGGDGRPVVSPVPHDADAWAAPRSAAGV